jgi:hypothetical protein
LSNSAKNILGGIHLPRIRKPERRWNVRLFWDKWKSIASDNSGAGHLILTWQQVLQSDNSQATAGATFTASAGATGVAAGAVTFTVTGTVTRSLPVTRVMVAVRVPGSSNAASTLTLTTVPATGVAAGAGARAGVAALTMEPVYLQCISLPVWKTIRNMPPSKETLLFSYNLLTITADYEIL